MFSFDENGPTREGTNPEILATLNKNDSVDYIVIRMRKKQVMLLF